MRMELILWHFSNATENVFFDFFRLFLLIVVQLNLVDHFSLSVKI